MRYFILCYETDFDTVCLVVDPLNQYDKAQREINMKKLLLIAALAGGLAFGGFAETAKADQRGHGNRGGNHHGHSHDWNRGGYRGGYNNSYRYRGNYNNAYRPRSGINLQFNYGGYGGYGYGGYGSGFGYGGYNSGYDSNCW